MYWQGIVIGLVCFIIIGVFHPVIIKGEYYYGVKLWWVFLVCGLLSLTGSLFIESILISAILGVLGFTLFWSILEIFEQRARVRKGWFPMGPSHKK